MASDPLNPYEEDREKSPGEEDVEKGNYLVMFFRVLRVDMSKRENREAVERTGELLALWFRTKILMKESKE